MKNWKNDDELLNLAFGELSDRDSQALEAKLLGDSSAQKELDLLRTLRSDMIAIRDDIPEMQFSKERLREAILSSGAKPARQSFPWLNWVLGPAALASVAALAFVMTKGVSNREPVIVASNGKPAVEQVIPKVNIKAPAGLTEERVASASSPSTSSELSQPSVTEAAVRRTSKPAKKRIRGRASLENLVASRSDGTSSASTMMSEGVKSTSADAATMTLAAPAGSAIPGVVDTAPIILIDANTDSGAGAPTATEVSNPSNVAIGG